MSLEVAFSRTYRLGLPRHGNIQQQLDRLERHEHELLEARSFDRTLERLLTRHRVG